MNDQIWINLSQIKSDNLRFLNVEKQLIRSPLEEFHSITIKLGFFRRQREFNFYSGALFIEVC